MKVTIKVKPEEFPALASVTREQEKKYPASLVAEDILRSFFATFVRLANHDSDEAFHGSSRP